MSIVSGPEVTRLILNSRGPFGNLSKVRDNGTLVTMPSVSGGLVRVNRPLIMTDVKIHPQQGYGQLD